MLSIWNKGDGDNSVRSDSEVAHLAILYKQIDADGDRLASAIEEYADLPKAPVVEEPVIEGASECLPDEECTVPTPEDLACTE